MVNAVVLLNACSLADSDNIVTTNDIDPAGGLSRADYLALRNRHGTDDGLNAKKAPPIPSIPDNADEAPTGPLAKRVNLEVSDSVPVRDVLMELVNKTGANLELDPRVQGSVIISAHDEPLQTVLQRICDSAGLRYSIDDGGFIHIEPDDPYEKTYQLDYLNLSRKTTGETGIATNVFDVDVSGNNSGIGGAAGGGGNGVAATQNNSTAKVASLSEADFWAETQKSLAQILAAHARTTGDNSKSDFSTDKQAGLVTVYGTQAQQQAVAAYVAQLRRKAYAQVLIDARIIEVELDDNYQSGIDWTGVFSNAFGAAANFGTQVANNTNGYFTAGLTGTNFSSLINLVQTFGTTRVLSAPRITVLNNQTAVMKVATNQVYFVTQAQFTTTTNANGSSVTTNPVYTSTPRTVPVGLVMTVQPAIDAAHDRVTMTLRPTISRIVGEVDDPSINLNAAIAGVADSVPSQIPVLAVREMDSVIQLHSGAIAVMGGLMQDSSINQDQGVPLLSDLPYVSSLFKSRSNDGKTSELIILLRATIADTPAPDAADDAVYRRFGKDPRQMTLPPLPADKADDEDHTGTPTPQKDGEKS
ncbi:MAG: secretin N-terminal domain-containing protein [Alphaproteobacteria bacterium]|nr:secretin N-terminal domain-containing protein [Alphaproteobacteria bacterium]